MLKVRYLTAKGINPVPYVKDEFNAEILRLLELPQEDFFRLYMAGSGIKKPISYLATIGVYNAGNSNFLYDYLVTLNQEQFSTEMDATIELFVYVNLRAPNFNINMILDAGRDIVIRDQKFEIKGENSNSVLCNIALSDPKLAMSSPEWENVNAIDWVNTDVFRNLDVYISFLKKKNKLYDAGIKFLVRTLRRFTDHDDLMFKDKEDPMNSIKVVEILEEIIRKFDTDCIDLFIELQKQEITRWVMIVIAEAIVRACPQDYSQFVGNTLSEWWERRSTIDV